MSADGVTSDGGGGLGDELLAQAAARLRDRPRGRAVEVANGVLDQAMRAARTGVPLRARAPYDFLLVADHLIVAAIRLAVDDRVAGAATGRVVLGQDGEHHLSGVTVELFARFGVVLVEVADAARSATTAAVAAVLGPQDAEAVVTVVHMHVSDVTRGDPREEQPG